MRSGAADRSMPSRCPYPTHLTFLVNKRVSGGSLSQIRTTYIISPATRRRSKPREVCGCVRSAASTGIPITTRTPSASAVMAAWMHTTTPANSGIASSLVPGVGQPVQHGRFKIMIFSWRRRRRLARVAPRFASVMSRRPSRWMAPMARYSGHNPRAGHGVCLGAVLAVDGAAQPEVLAIGGELASGPGGAERSSQPIHCTRTSRCRSKIK